VTAAVVDLLSGQADVTATVVDRLQGRGRPAIPGYPIR